ncbi:phosphoglycolate phosphatase [Hydrogenimonas sp. SS33]|uniref:phosphoglycolate phosphatase n=1 Tax=Hydrogenimonas leucolamina TaxID=2954236 RepID=UPI00336BD8C5
MKQFRVQAVLFDLDGTLIDSVPDLAAGVNAMLAYYALPPLGEEEVRMMVGNGATVLVTRALQKCGAGERVSLEEALARFMEAYRERMCDRTRCFDGVAETLQSLKERGKRLGIVTNKPYRFVPPILEHLGIESCFGAVLGGDSLPQKKPDPAPLVEGARMLGTEPQKALMVGDSSNDIRAAKAAGMPCVGVCYGYNYGESIEAEAPDATIDRLDKLLEIVL